MFLNPNDQQELRAYFHDRLEGTLRVVVFGQSEPHIDDPLPIQHELCADVWDLMVEVKALSDRLSLAYYDVNAHPSLATQYNVHRVPATLFLDAAGNDLGLRFFGLPTGLEFSAFLESLVNAANQRVDLKPATVAQLGEIRSPVTLRVFYTPNCVLCPLMTHLAQQFALATPLLRAEAIDAMEFPNLARHYDIKGVPFTVINEHVSFSGLKPEQDLLEAVLQAAKTPCPVLIHSGKVAQ